MHTHAGTGRHRHRQTHERAHQLTTVYVCWGGAKDNGLSMNKRNAHGPQSKCGALACKPGLGDGWGEESGKGRVGPRGDGGGVKRGWGWGWHQLHVLRRDVDQRGRLMLFSERRSRAGSAGGEEWWWNGGGAGGTPDLDPQHHGVLPSFAVIYIHAIQAQMPSSLLVAVGQLAG